MRIKGKGNTLRIHDCCISFINFVLNDMFQMIPCIADTSERTLDLSYNVRETKNEATLTWHKRRWQMSHIYTKHRVQHKLALGMPLS